MFIQRLGANTPLSHNAKPADFHRLNQLNYIQVPAALWQEEAARESLSPYSRMQLLWFVV